MTQRVSDERLEELKHLIARRDNGEIGPFVYAGIAGTQLPDLIADLQDARAQNKRMREALNMIANPVAYCTTCEDEADFELVGSYCGCDDCQGEYEEQDDAYIAKRALAAIDAEGGGEG